MCSTSALMYGRPYGPACPCQVAASPARRNRGRTSRTPVDVAPPLARGLQYEGRMTRALLLSAVLLAACGGEEATTDTTCYSPTQNVKHAYDEGAHGCACDASKEPDVCVDGAALVCSNGTWHAVYDGPCMPPRP